jgi:hypothetical protein
MRAFVGRYRNSDSITDCVSVVLDIIRQRTFWPHHGSGGPFIGLATMINPMVAQATDQQALPYAF